MVLKIHAEIMHYMQRCASYKMSNVMLETKYIVRKCHPGCSAGKVFSDCKLQTLLCEWEPSRDTILFPPGEQIQKFQSHSNSNIRAKIELL